MATVNPGHRYMGMLPAKSWAANRQS